MSAGGFQILMDEWWHFVALDWQAFAPTRVSLRGNGEQKAPNTDPAVLPKKRAVSAR